MDQKPREPLSWEVKAAIGCLVLLLLQVFHEISLLALDSDKLGHAHLKHLTLVTFVAVVGAGFGLLLRTRLGWWCAIIVIGVWSFGHLLMFLQPVLNYVKARSGSTFEDEWILVPILNKNGFYWVLVRGVLLIACPLLLLLGELRSTLRRD